MSTAKQAPGVPHTPSVHRRPSDSISVRRAAWGTSGHRDRIDRMRHTGVQDLAHRLLQAERTADPIPPLSATHPEFGRAEAHAVQRAGRTARIAAGRRIVGHTIRPSSHGYLTDAMVLASGATIDARGLIAPRIEARIALRLGSPLAGAGVTAEQVLAATEAVAIAVEVIDSRIAGRGTTVVESIADNASSARAVIGEWTAPGRFDLAALSVHLVVDYEPFEAALEPPADSMARVARALHAGGDPLAAGELVLTGATNQAVPVRAGSRATATVDGLGQVALSLSTRRED